MSTDAVSDDFPNFDPPEGLVLSAKQRLAKILPFSAYQVTAAANANAANNADPDKRFVLFTKDFLQLQVVITQAMALPAAQGDFDTKYGTFSQKDVVTGCVTALKKLQDHCLTFGNPTVLVSEVSKLAEGEKPKTIYGKLVWLSHKIANVAENFESAFKYLPAEFKKLKTETEKAAYLKEMLMGEGGLVSEAATMASEADALSKEVLDYLNTMNTVKKPVMDYFSKSKPDDANNLYNVAKAKHTELTQKVEQMQKEVDALGDEYLKYVAITTGVSVGLLVVSMGMLWPVSAVTGGVLGSMTENLRKARNDLSAQLDGVRGDVAKKLALVTDINGFNPAIDRVAGNLDSVCKGLAVIAGVWTGVVTRLTAVATETKPDQLAKLSEQNVTRKINSARDKWDKVVEATYQFTTEAFVEIREEPRFSVA